MNNEYILLEWPVDEAPDMNVFNEYISRGLTHLYNLRGIDDGMYYVILSKDSLSYEALEELEYVELIERVA